MLEFVNVTAGFFTTLFLRWESCSEPFQKAIIGGGAFNSDCGIRS